ncbi:MAG: ferrochelatase [Coriobacteriales bacterium]|jgi:ferrochelatase|nr:ferrochelatase [Coriobacteriales bacterium]
MGTTTETVNSIDAEKAGQLGVLLVNTGTPDAPTKEAVQRYLKGFLGDRRIVNIPPLIWRPILNSFVLHARPRKTLAIYQSIWTEQGSPYTLHSQALERAITQQLTEQGHDGKVVRMAHRYGNPSMRDGLAEFQQLGIEQVMVVPLYPQEAFATTGSAHDELKRQLAALDYHPSLSFVQNYFDDAAYLSAVVEHIRPRLCPTQPGSKLVFSFHSIPLKDRRNGDPYQEQVIATTQKLADLLQLPAGSWSVAYQSRFDDAQRWLGPYLADEAKRFVDEGVTDLYVYCPGFAVDCTETLYDIEQKVRGELERYAHKQAGCVAFRLHYIPALNDALAHAQALVQVITQALPAEKTG